MTKRNKIDTAPTPPHVQTAWHGLLTYLTGDVDLTMHMARQFTPDDVPADMPFERDYLQGIITCRDKGFPPTRINIQNAMLLNRKDMPAELETFANSLYAAVDLGVNRVEAVRMNSGWVHQFMVQEHDFRVFQDAMKIAENPAGSHDSNMQAAMTYVVQNLARNSRTAGIRLSAPERLQQFLDHQRKRVADRKAGRALGVQVPWPTLHNIIPVLRYGDMSLWTAKTKVGKTTITDILAEHNAWQADHDVLVIHMETDHDTYQERQICRYLHVHAKHIITGYFDPDDQRISNNGENTIAERVQIFQYGIQTTFDNSGQVFYFYCPGSDMAMLRAAIDFQCYLSAQRGRKVLVIIDYLQKIKVDGLDRYLGFTNNASDIKDIVAQYPGQLHVMLFAQEKTDSTSHEAFGTTEVKKLCQAHFAIERNTADRATADMPREDGATDIYGNARYWHRTGDFFSEFKVELVDSNNTGRGFVDLRMEAGMFIVEERSHQSMFDGQ